MVGRAESWFAARSHRRTRRTRAIYRRTACSVRAALCRMVLLDVQEATSWRSRVVLQRRSGSGRISGLCRRVPKKERSRPRPRSSGEEGCRVGPGYRLVQFLAPLQSLFLRMALKASIPPIGLSTRDITNIGVLARDMTKVGKTLTDFFYTALQTSMWSLSSDSRVHGRRRG
jgi:hypothetical protein